MALHKQPNGVYHIRFTLNGKQIARSAETKNKSIAAQLEAQMRSDALKRALEGYPDRITVHAALDKYLAEKEHTASYTTSRTSVKALKKGITDKSLEKLNAHDVHDMAVFVLNTGARYSEVTNIQWQDVDLEKRTLTLYRKKVDNYGTLPISDELYAVLRRREQKSGYVFPGKCGERTYSMIPLRSAAGASGLNDPAVVGRTGCRVSWHVLRHYLRAKWSRMG